MALLPSCPVPNSNTVRVSAEERREDIKEAHVEVSTEERSKVIVEVCIEENSEVNSDLNEVSVPDHGPIIRTIDVQNATSNADHFPVLNKTIRYDTRKIPRDFLTNISGVEEKIIGLEKELSDNRNICEAYSSFVDIIIIKIELKQRVPQLKTSSCSSRKRKSLHKPHWNDELSKLWKSVCDKEKAWIKCNEHCSKRKLRKEFCEVRDIFDKTNRRFKRLHQSHEQDRLLNLYESANKQDFWKQFGKIGIANDRKSSIPMKVETDNGFSSDPGDVLQRWKHDFHNLLNKPLSSEFDDIHLDFIKTGSHTFPSVNCDSLNRDITEEEVRNKRSSNLAAMGDMGWLKGDNLVKIELFRYWNRLKLNDNILCKTVHKWASRRKSSWDDRVLSIGRELHVLNDQSDTVCIDDVWDSLWEREVDICEYFLRHLVELNCTQSTRIKISNLGIISIQSMRHRKSRLKISMHSIVQ
ncbi:hypothetical protein LOTGIDRAFT_156854 [Lottia gigantea]|uniref:Uncharacterized protein n=1 Tax=Lottia gigantea TaxID=225164 RepID=V4AFV9_LOTGI|nr:hypothetical protein LOTGIDRAFT_156854 [Lottia gigantea]ESP02899.1 hypothetical protein LOTGIDRAFT_156854 [Lottia gigantea]